MNATGIAPAKEFRDRTRGKSRYLRRAAVKIFGKTKAEREAYKPENGYEEVMMKLFDRCMDSRYGNSAIEKLALVLGEKSSVNEKQEKGPTTTEIEDDLPRSVPNKA